MASLRQHLSAHAWTLRAGLGHVLERRFNLEEEPWSVPLEDPRRPGLRLSGQLRRKAASDTAVVIVHGLGGSAESPYVRRLARACAARGWDYVRPHLRGAAFDGSDFYHAGLSEDLERAASAFAGYGRIFMVGVSLGGHLALHHALTHRSCHAVAVVSAPLDLDRSSLALDAGSRTLYREAVLASLKRAYRAYARRHPEVAPYARISPIRTIREWDRRVVVPRFGFDDVDAYYRAMSVGPRLGDLGIPALYVGALADPMVPSWTVVPRLAEATAVETRLLTFGGHGAFPPRLLVGGLPGPLEDYVLSWLEQRVPRR